MLFIDEAYYLYRTKHDLQTIEKADIRASSLFDEEAPDDELDEKHAPGNTS